MPIPTTPLQVPGGPELVVLALILLPLIVLAIIGFVLVRRLLDLPDPSRVADLEREVVELRETVGTLEERVDDRGEDEGGSEN
jgi:cell division protein FtsB